MHSDDGGDNNGVKRSSSTQMKVKTQVPHKPKMDPSVQIQCIKAGKNKTLQNRKHKRYRSGVRKGQVMT